MPDNYSDEEKNKSIALIASVLFVLVLGIVMYLFFSKFLLTANPSELREGHRDEAYCKMVKRYMDTNGKEGWRDYRGIYYKECLNQ